MLAEPPSLQFGIAKLRRIHTQCLDWEDELVVGIRNHAVKNVSKP